VNIVNNDMANMSLGTLNKNISQASLRLARLASGAKIRGALVNGNSDSVNIASGADVVSPKPNIYEAGKNATWSGNIAGLAVEIRGGNITFTAKGLGEKGNGCYVSDGFEANFTTRKQIGTKKVNYPATPEVPGTPPVYQTVHYK